MARRPFVFVQGMAPREATTRFAEYACSQCPSRRGRGPRVARLDEQARSGGRLVGWVGGAGGGGRGRRRGSGRLAGRLEEVAMGGDPIEEGLDSLARTDSRRPAEL